MTIRGKYLIGLLIIAVSITTSVATSRQSSELHLVVNPYAEIDWASVQQHKANLHAHTTKSDGLLKPAQVIDAYHELGYSVLSITDHDTAGDLTPTWPWQEFGRDPEQLGMVAIQGNELSFQHHMGSFYSNYHGREGGSSKENLEKIGTVGGLAIFFHPGRYNEPPGWSWYIPYFERHDHLLGIEVFNQGDRYPNDRQLWDRILIKLMPERPVWGFSNDDSHKKVHIGRNWNTLLLDKLNEESVRSSLTQGQFYITHQPGEIKAPIITGIKVDDNSITIEAAGYKEIHWISQGKVVHKGSTLNFNSVKGIENYVRARVKGDGGEALTNPFGFRRIDSIITR